MTVRSSSTSERQATSPAIQHAGGIQVHVMPGRHGCRWVTATLSGMDEQGAKRITPRQSIVCVRSPVLEAAATSRRRQADALKSSL